MRSVGALNDQKNHEQIARHFPFAFSPRSDDRIRFSERPNRVALLKIKSGFWFKRAVMASKGSGNFESSIKRRSSFIDHLFCAIF
jgi:hypothetical protein